jgi:hypothetical protein
VLGKTVDNADVDIATLLVGLYKNAVLFYPARFIITATEIVLT